MAALYNEIDPYACQWLRNLSAAGHIAQGVVYGLSIKDLEPRDFAHRTQAHFFAGIGVWSHALRLAGWPDDVPVWTGSCPCQPFSTAGKRGGFADDRHLWPDWFALIRECRPPVVFGEQVASPDGLAWLDLVRSDLEGEGYAFGAADLCAAGVGAPHIRQRLYWVAHSDEPGQRIERCAGLLDREREAQRHYADGCRTARGVAYAAEVERGSGRPRVPCHGPNSARLEPDGLCAACGVGDASGRGRCESRLHTPSRDLSSAGRENPECCDAGPTRGFWARADWIPCRDGKARPVEPGSFPLAHGAPARVGRLRAYGNSIVSEVAETFIRAVIDSGFILS